MLKVPPIAFQDFPVREFRSHQEARVGRVDRLQPRRGRGHRRDVRQPPDQRCSEAPLQLLEGEERKVVGREKGDQASNFS